MNGRRNQFIKLAAQINQTPPRNFQQVLEINFNILQILMISETTGLHKEKDQSTIETLKPYIEYVKDELGLKVEYENDRWCVKNVHLAALSKLNEMREKEKFALEVSKNVLNSQAQIYSALNIKLDKILKLLENKPSEKIKSTILSELRENDRRASHRLEILSRNNEKVSQKTSSSRQVVSI